MKKLYFIAAIALFPVKIYSQTASCSQPTAQTQLDINNVRATIMNGGDMFWDAVSNAGYEIPKGSGKHSLFASALWIGGVNGSGQLKVAAQMYRSNGTDFFAGPLTIGTAITNSTTCIQYDKIHKLNRSIVNEFSLKYNQPGYTIPQEILNWPAHGNTAQGYSYYLAPFHDKNNDGDYNPYDGDYPDYDFNNTNQYCDNKLSGDQTLWWIFNDGGNTHTNSGGEAIGLEIHAQAFAFSTNDEINNQTFYKYKIINRSSNALYETYIGQWTDADIGYYLDDYIGCDVERGIGYAYNGTEIDGSGAPNHYGANPPAVGFDFMQGPYQDFDGIDNGVGIFTNESINGTGYGDAIADNERLGMSRFIYFSSTGNPSYNDPSQASHYYNYLKGYWKDNTPITYTGDPNTPAKFMFPGNSDQQYHFGTNGVVKPEWSEVTDANPSGDRRFVMSAGPFTMEPGAVNYLTMAALWARAVSGGPMASVEKLKLVSDKAQLLLNSCFNNSVLAVNKNKKEAGSSLFPNPFTEQASLKFDNPMNTKHTIQVYDMTGRVVQELSTISNKIVIERKNLSPGVYLFNISGEKDGNSISGKFVVE